VQAPSALLLLAMCAVLSPSVPRTALRLDGMLGLCLGLCLVLLLEQERKECSPHAVCVAEPNVPDLACTSSGATGQLQSRTQCVNMHLLAWKKKKTETN